MIEIAEVTRVTDDLVSALGRLLPQLSPSYGPPSRADLEEMIGSSASILFIARDQAKGGEIVGGLTLVLFRIPSGVRAWIEDVVARRVYSGIPSGATSRPKPALRQRR